MRRQPASRPIARQLGFLLAEFVVGIGLAGILGTIVVSAVFQLNRASGVGEAKLATLTEVQKATTWLARDIRRASSSDLADGAPAVTEATFNWTESDGTPHSCFYQLSGSDLARTCDASTSVVARSVSALSFARAGGLVSIDFTVTPGAGAAYDEDVSLRVFMRAR